MAGPFDWISQYLPGGTTTPGNTSFGPDDAYGAPTINQDTPDTKTNWMGYPTDNQSLGRYTGPTAAEGSIIGPAGWDWITGKPTTGQVGRAQDLEQRQASAFLAGKAAELQHANPTAMPDELFKQLFLDKSVQDKLMDIPAGQHGKVLTDLMKQFQPTPPKYTHAGPGSVIGEESTGKPGSEYKRVDTVPQTAAQMGVGKLDHIIQQHMKNNFGEDIIVPHVQNPDNTLTPLAPDPRTGQLVPAMRGQDGNYYAVPAGQRGVGTAQTQAQPGQGGPVGTPRSDAFAQGKPVPGSQPGREGAGMQPPTSEVLPRKADMVDAFGPVGQATKAVGGFTGQGADRQTAANNQLQQLRGSLIAMEGASTRLKGELKAREALLPSESPWLVHPITGAQQLIQIHDWVSNSIQRARADIDSDFVSIKSKQEADKEIRHLQPVLQALGPRDDLVAKLAELKSGKGGTSFKELGGTIPSRKQIGDTVGAAREAATTTGQNVGVLTEADKAAAAADLQGLTNAQLQGLVKGAAKLPPDQFKQLQEEVRRRKEAIQSGKEGGRIAPGGPPGNPR